MARYLRQPNVDKMLREMSSVQWLEWKTLMTLTPFLQEEERADIRAAIIALAVWNVEIAKAQGSWDANKKGRRGKRPVFRELHDFIVPWGDAPDTKPKPKKLSAKQQFERLKDSFAALGMKPVKR